MADLRPLHLWSEPPGGTARGLMSAGTLTYDGLDWTLDTTRPPAEGYFVAAGADLVIDDAATSGLSARIVGGHLFALG